MHGFKTFSVLALVSAALAAPRPWGDWPAGGVPGFGNGGSDVSDNDNNDHQGRPGGFPGFGNFQGGGRPGGYDHDDKPAVEEVVVTKTQTVTWDGKFGNGYHQPTGAPAPGGYSGGAPSAPAPQPEAPSAPSTGDSGSSSTGYMAIVDEWRSNLGLSKLTHDSGLEANALKTAQDGRGSMKHQLIGKTMAQVLAPGSSDEFEHVFVGGWLCERPSMSGLNGVCAQQSKGWSYGGQTGHADILVSSAYSKIGCAEAGGIWSCDLA